MKLGAEPKKIAILGGLLAVAAIVLYTQVFSGPSQPAPARRAVAANAPPPVAIPAGRADTTRRRTTGVSVGEFKPRVGELNPQDRRDPATIDPQIRFDLLAKLQSVEPESSGRNIFQLGAAPAAAKPDTPLPKVTPPIQVTKAGAAPTSGPAAAPPAPPITFHYYGFKIAKANGRKQAFLLDGDEIMIAGENDTVKRGRYKVKRIGVNSITIEDTQFNHEQTLQLEEVTG